MGPFYTKGKCYVRFGQMIFILENSAVILVEKCDVLTSGLIVYVISPILTDISTQ
jgi:hypothetical protein